ncbi:unnamed protein product [Prorocentrum cordatum]|uniref:Mono(ADP-ribosyl)transferase n=1 Tax=Prorocentrum cordatum TaxID=2364126 RepID=A0ABN9RQ44_9DINO|nr:unnamed protein product [Polarella glacialis]
MPPSFWVPHPDLVWAPCAKKSDGVYADEDGKQVFHSGSVNEVKDSQIEGADDVCNIDVVTEAVLLHNVRLRYKRQVIYTNISRILVAVNPFKKIAIFGEEWLKRYIQPSAEDRTTPHIYNVGYDAVTGIMASGKRSQAVLVSGESGAGKTESAKLVLGYIAAYSSGSGQRYDMSAGEAAKAGPKRTLSRYSSTLTEGKVDIQDQIMKTNPILEAFGNAMTQRNNNSSRFGKWLELSFDGRGQIAGCQIVDYVLELTRVTGTAKVERNYHVFFALAHMRDSNELQGLGMLPPSKYSYLKDCVQQAPSLNDAQIFEEIVEAFQSLEFEASLQKEIFSVVAGILELGNVKFAEVGESLAFAEEAKDLSEGRLQGAKTQDLSEEHRCAAQRAADLLGLNLANLGKALLTRESVVGGEKIQRSLKADQAAFERDAFVRLVYGRLFKWLICKMNQKLLNGVEVTRFLGLLDIAGFESFATNSLEQLLINLSNEHLQAHFNHSFFTMEIEVYRAEGVNLSFDDVGFNDNKDIIELIAGKGGIFSILDDSGTLAKSADSDQKWVDRACKELQNHKRFGVPKFKGSFTVKHFAGPVEYQAKGFLEKNLNKPPREGPNCIVTSSNSVLKEIGGTVIAELDLLEQAAKGTKRKAQTVSNEFKESIAALMSKLKEADPHFIRCIKPNPEKKPDMFHSQLVMEQLLYSGALEAVKIRQSGYALRMPFEDFVAQYHVLLPKAHQADLLGREGDARGRAEALLGMLPEVVSFAGKEARLRPEDKEALFGNTKLFARASFHARLEMGLQLLREQEEELRRQAKVALQEAIQSRAVPQLREAIQLCQEVGVPEEDLTEVKRVLEEALQREGVLTRIQEGIAVRDVRAVKDAVADGQRLQMSEQELADARAFLKQEQLAWARGEVEKAMTANQAEGLRTAIKDAEEAGIPSGDELLARARKALAAMEATEALQSAVQSRDVSQLEAAIQAGEPVLEQGSEALADARRVLREEAAKTAARQQLAAAVQAGDLAALTAALGAAEEVRLEAGELEQASAALALAEARAACSAQRLRPAIEAGEAAGLPRGQLDAAREALAREERREEAAGALREALAAGGLEPLQAAVRAAEDCGVDVALLEEARAAVQLEGQKAAARARLKDATDRREAGALRAALGVAEAARLEPRELEEGRRVLLEEERKAAAISRGDAAAASARGGSAGEVRRAQMEELRAAIDECQAACVDAALVQALRGQLATEEAKDQSLARLREAAAGYSAEDLQAAIEACESLGVVAPELSGARLRVTVLLQQESANRAVERATEDADALALEQAIAAAKAAGIDEERLEPSRLLQRLLAAEERGDLEGLRAAIQAVEDRGLRVAHLAEARQVLQDLERQEAASQGLQSAVRSQDAGRLREAIAEGQAAGLPEFELRPAREALQLEERKDEARSGLQRAVEGGDVGVLHSALAESRECGILGGPELAAALEAFSALTDTVAEAQDLRAMRCWLLPVPRALLFEQFWRSAQGAGFGGMDWKATGPPPVAGASVGAHFTTVLEGAWRAKSGTVLAELCANLRLCRLREGRPLEGSEPLGAAAAGLGYRQLFQAAWELRAVGSGAGGVPEALTRHPLSLFCMLLYTQQGADVDRMLLFPDVPALQPSADATADGEQRARTYQAYRDRLASARCVRNSAVAVEAIRAAAGCTDALRALDAEGLLGAAPAAELLEERGVAAKGALEAWVKCVCLLSTLACEPLPERTVTKVMVGAPAGLVSHLRGRRPGDTIFWAAPLSTTMDAEVANRYIADSDASVQDVVLKISGVRQGLELFRVSQYPEEQELLLPACSLLEIKKISSRNRQLYVECDYRDTLLSKDLRTAVWGDLRDTTYDLARLVAEERPSPSAGSPPPLVAGSQGAGGRVPRSAQPVQPLQGRTRSPRGPGSSAKAASGAARSTTAPGSRAAGPPGPKGMAGASAPGPAGQSGAALDAKVESLLSVFEVMDRRGTHQIGRDDYMWALKKFSKDPEVMKVARNVGISSHFFESPEDLTLLRFLYLALSNLSETEKDRALRFAVSRMRRQRVASASNAWV